MTFRRNKPRVLAALRASALLLFLPAHLAFVLLIDLDFIPNAGGAPTVRRPEDRGPDKERLRLHLHRKSDSRVTCLDVQRSLPSRDVHLRLLHSQVPPDLCAGESVVVKLTRPAALAIWSAATPHNSLAPPA